MRNDRYENAIFKEVEQGVRWMHALQLTRLRQVTLLDSIAPIRLYMQISAVVRHPKGTAECTGSITLFAMS
jgi:hypothetical protein